MQNPQSCFSFLTLESQQLGLIPETTKSVNLKGVLQEGWTIFNSSTKVTKQFM